MQRELMRHASIETTMNVYGRATMSDAKCQANSKVVRMAGVLAMAKYSVQTGDAGRVKCIMHVLLAAALVLRAATVIDVHAEVKRGHMIVQRKDGRRVSGRVFRVQQVSFIRCHESLRGIWDFSPITIDAPR